MLDPRMYLTVAAVMFALGIYGVITRRNAIGILLSLELMANAVNINLVAFARYSTGAIGQVFASNLNTFESFTSIASPSRVLGPVSPSVSA